MDGLCGLEGWRWLFILGTVHPSDSESLQMLKSTAEGSITCAMSVMLWFTVPDFPEDASWLTPDERALVESRLNEDVGESGHREHLTVRRIFQLLTDCGHDIALFSLFTQSCFVCRSHHTGRFDVSRPRHGRILLQSVNRCFACSKFTDTRIRFDRSLLRSNGHRGLRA